jgi:glycosyltransferase involved in cell wall biosynthesis
MHKIVPTVIKILSCDDKRFELVVRDNCSEDSTLRILDEIVDPRLRVIAGMENLGGVGGILESLAQGHGIFLMVCLDKDLIEPSLIPGLLDLLESLSSVGVGFCEVIGNSANPFTLYPTGFPAIYHLGYRVRHPSGYFFRSKDFARIVSRLNLTQKTTGGFPFELLSAEIATSSALAVINSPIIVTETKKEAQQYKSLTYKGGAAFFFLRKGAKFLKLLFLIWQRLI